VVVAKYLSGVGVVVTVGFVLSALYLFTVDLASGMMVLIITVGQAVVVGLVYTGAVVSAGSSDSVSGSDTTLATDSSETQEPRSEPDPEPESVATGDENIEDHTESAGTPDTTQDPESPSGQDIDWWDGAQIFIGATIFLIGIPITVQSPIGVLILLVGLALIPRIRAWSMETLGRSNPDTESES
jgi:Flp pilus assembly protein TadB